MNQILPSDCLAVVGQRGSGKTYLLSHLAEHLRYGLFLDTKGTEGVPGWPVTSDLLEALRLPRAVYRVPAEEDPEKAADRLAWGAFRRGHTTLIVDEAAHVSGANRIPRGLRVAITQGRAKGVGVWAGSQRPVDVSNFFFSESEHFFVGLLTLESDRLKVAGFVPGLQTARDSLTWTPFSFWYYNPKMRKPIRFRLEG